MAVIGVTVSEKRPYPYQLDILDKDHDILPIKPGEQYRILTQLDVLYLWDLAYDELIEYIRHCDSLPKYIFVARQGVDADLTKYIEGKDSQLIYAKGVFTKSISEFILASVMLLSKNLHLSVAEQTWVKHNQQMVSGTKALLLGRGDISTHAKKLLENMGIEVKQISRAELIKTLNSSESNETTDYFSEVNHVVSCLPLEKDTAKILNKVFFDYFHNINFINISRGGILNTADLSKALDQGKVKAALLDAFTVEPLPRGSVLWKDKRIVVSPHQSYRTPDWESLLHASFINFVETHGIISR